MQKVIISILNFNGTKDTLECLRSIQKLDHKDIKLSTYVLDNGSTEPLIVDNNFKDIDLNYFRSTINLGFTGGHNLILDKVKNLDFDFFLLLNNDCILDKNCLVELINTANKNDNCCVVPKIYFTKGREYHKTWYQKKDLGKVIWYAGGKFDWNNVVSVHIGLDEVDNGQFDEEKEVTFATGACLLIPKKIINKIGLFDKKYFLYYEDADLSMRIIRSGFRICYQPRSIIWHNNAGSSSSGSTLHDYYLTRNRLLFGMKYATVRLKIHLLKEAIKLYIAGREWQKIGVRDFFIRRFEKGSYDK